MYVLLADMEPVSYTHLDVYKRQAMSRERVLKTYVNEVKKNYDYVLIDCMPSLGMITINALAAADSVIIPCLLYTSRCV